MTKISLSVSRKHLTTFTQTLVLSSALMIASSQASFAAAQCYDEIEVEDPMACVAQDPNNKSADFTSGCDLGGTKIIKVPRECEAKWVAYGAPNPASRAFATPYKALKHSEVCAKAGLLPTTIDGASCASGTYYGTDVSQTSSNEGGSSNGSGGQRTVTSIFCVGGKDSGNNAPTGVWGSEPGDGVQAQQHLLTHYACGE